MFRNKLLANAAVSLAVMAFFPMPAAAAAPAAVNAPTEATPQSQDSTRGVRIGRGRTRTLGVAEGTVSPERAAEILASATTVAASAGLPCQVTEAKSLGTLVDTEAELFEVVCASGPGYLIAATTPPTALNCVALAASAAQTRAQNPNADVGAECSTPRNLDVIASIQPYAQAAGVDCQIDQAAWLGKPDEASDRYEIGCAGTAGYWVEAPSNSFEPNRVLSCTEVAAAGATCRFTTREEIAVSVGAMAAAAGRTCQVTEARFAGQNSSGRFFEAACADGPGFMFRVNDNRVDQTWDCADAARIGGGCQLTDPEVINASAAETEQARLNRVGLNCAYQAHRPIGADNRGRDVVEYQCSDQPLGMIAFIGQSSAESEGMDCLASELLAVSCSLTGKSTVAEALTRMMAADGHSCTVVDFDVLSPAARASRGEAVEVKCADGSGYLVEAPADRQRTGQVRSCTQAREFGESCNL